MPEAFELLEAPEWFGALEKFLALGLFWSLEKPGSLGMLGLMQQSKPWLPVGPLSWAETAVSVS